jgi:hypothetical protein
MPNLKIGKYQKLLEITLSDYPGRLTAVKTARVAFHPRIKNHLAERLPVFFMRSREENNQ